MNPTLIFGYLITFIYCSNSEEKFPETSHYSLRQAAKSQGGDNLRRVPARSLTLTEHERNLVGLRNILNKMRAEREKNKNKNSVSVEELKPKEMLEVEESKQNK